MKIRTAQINDLNELKSISEEQFHLESLRPKFNNLIFDKDYVVKVIDSNSVETQIRCWGVDPVKDSLAINRPYMLKPKYSMLHQNTPQELVPWAYRHLFCRCKYSGDAGIWNILLLHTV